MVKKKLIKIGMISIILFIIFVLALCLGTTVITPRHLIKILIGDRQSVSARILIYVRLPRVLATLLVGAAFAVSGVIVQSVLNNSLAAPNIIGVNAGGGLGTVLWMAFMPYQINYLPFAAFIGAFLAVILVYFISNSIGISRMTLILSGIAISSLLNAMSDTVITFFPDALAGLSAFKVGGVSGISFARIQPLWLYVVGGIILAFILSNELDILSLGDKAALSLGLSVKRIRFVFLVLAALLAGSAVSCAGLVGFVGLIVPHIGRRLIGGESRWLIPLSALLGASFVTGCDLLARVLFAPFELPVGIIISYIGVPFFLYLLLKEKRNVISFE